MADTPRIRVLKYTQQSPYPSSRMMQLVLLAVGLGIELAWLIIRNAIVTPKLVHLIGLGGALVALVAVVWYLIDRAQS